MVLSPHSASQARNRTRGPEVMAYGQVPSPAGLGRSGASAISSLRSAQPAARPPGAPCPSGRWARSLCGARESGRARGRSPGSRKVLLGRCLAWSSQLLTERDPPEPISQTGGAETRAAAKGHAARLVPSCRRFQNFPPPAHREFNDFQVRGAHNSWARPGACFPGRLLCPGRGQPGPCSLPGLQSQAGLPGQLRGRRGTAAPALTQHRRSLQSGRRGTHLKEEETEVPREPATNPRSHRAGTKSRAAAVVWEPQGQPAGGPRQPPRALLAPSTEACPRRSRRETGPRWRAACLPAGECAVWAWDAAGRVQGRRVSPRLWTRVRAMRRLSLQSESEVSLHLSLLLRLPRVGGSSESLDLGAGGKGFRKLLPWDTWQRLKRHIRWS